MNKHYGLAKENQMGKEIRITELLYIRHPKEKIHTNQVNFLEELSDSDRSENAQLFRLGNAAIDFYHETAPTEDVYQHWPLEAFGKAKKDHD